MEHKLILGGEQLLPFARSRIKALRATGLIYASQRFEIDGSTVEVRIAKDDSYIRIEGSQLKILSGAIREGNLVAVPAPTQALPNATKLVLRSYRATQNAWNTALKKNPQKPLGTFNDEEFLAKQGSQYTLIVPSMYSGMMAPAVQIILGCGSEVLYKSDWNDCHGIVKDSKGKPWLVEISLENGVRAMRLPMKKGSASGKNDAERNAVAMFGGIPTGGTFPSGNALTQAVADGTVLNLLEPSQLDDYLTKTPMALWVGWSFSPTLPVAYNVVRNEVSGVVRSYLYKITISINADQPAVTGAASLTLEESGDIRVTGNEVVGVRFHSPNGAVSYVPATYAELPPEGQAPIHVRHVGGALDVMRVKMYAEQSERLEYDNLSNFFYPWGNYVVRDMRGGSHHRIVGAVLSGAGSGVRKTTTNTVIERGSQSSSDDSGNTYLKQWAVSRKETTYFGQQHTLSFYRLARDSVVSFAEYEGHYDPTYSSTSTILFNGEHNEQDDVGFTPDDRTGDPFGEVVFRLQRFLFTQAGEEPYGYYPSSYRAPGSLVEISMQDGTFVRHPMKTTDATYSGLLSNHLTSSCFGEEPHSALVGQEKDILTGALLQGQLTNEHPSYNFIGYIK